MLDDGQPATAEVLDDLGIEQPGIDGPVAPALVEGWAHWPKWAVSA